MSRHWILCLALAVGVGVPTATAWEQSGKSSRGKERRDETFRMIDAYIVANIQESLGLDDDTYVKIIPVVTRLQKVRREFWEERARLQRRLRQLLESGTATESEVEKVLASLKAHEDEGPERIQEQMRELDALLTPLQQAKYRVFEGEVEHRLRALMRRGRRERRDP